MILMGNILLLMTHEGVILVFWTYKEVLDDSDSLGEGFSICNSLESRWF